MQENKKNIAICFSGAIRSFHLCQESIQEMVIKPLKVEYNLYLFGHFWTLKQEENVEALSYRMKWKKESEDVYEIIKNFDFTELVIEDYNSKREQEIMDGLIPLGLGEKILDTYKQITIWEKRDIYLNYAVNCMGMYYKIMMANKLKNDWSESHNMEFDYVIRMRPDFIWNEKIPDKIFEKVTDKDIILVYDNYCTHARWKGNDKFFAGTSAMMDEYTNMYNQFEYFFLNAIRIEGQELAQAMIKKLGLNIIFFGSEKTYDKCAGLLHRQLEREITSK